MTAYDSAKWSEFALAQVGASAALLGLVFVGLSINLREFIGSTPLVHRAAEAVIALGGVLAISTAVLIPDQSRAVLSAELIVLALVIGAVVLRLQRDAHAQRDAAAANTLASGGPPRGTVALRRTLGLGPPLLVLVAAITFAASGGGGLYWWPAAVVAAYASAVMNSWVLLIEILR